MKQIICAVMFLGAILLMNDSVSAKVCPDPQAEPEFNQVMLFSEENYQGDCNIYTGFKNRFPRYQSPIRSLKAGSGIEIYINNKANYRGFAKGYKGNHPILNYSGGSKKKEWVAIDFGKIPEQKTDVPFVKQRTSADLLTDDTIVVCRTMLASCKSYGLGDHSLSEYYTTILVGKNVKAQTYTRSGFMEQSQMIYQGRHENLRISSVRVMGLNDQRVADQITPKAIPTPSLPAPAVPTQTNTPTVNTSTPNNPIDGAVRVVGKTELGLTVQNQQIQNNSNIILHPGLNNWIMRSDGAIVLKDNPRFGLTVKNQRIANGSEIILHEGYNLWKVLSDGAIVLKDNPSFGITVLNQNKNENAKIILHGGYNTWTKDHTGSTNVASSGNNPPPPKANHYPPPNNGGSPYVLCGYENQYCSFQGIGTVAYGVNGIFKYKQNVSRGIQCDDATFGFVVKGVEKRCYFKFEREIKRNDTPTETDKPSPPNGNFRVCGVEGKTCNFSGKGRVAYGYNDKNGRKFLFKQNVNGSIACNNQTFGGDPAPGKAKVCYVQVDR